MIKYLTICFSLLFPLNSLAILRLAYYNDSFIATYDGKVDQDNVYKFQAETRKYLMSRYGKNWIVESFIEKDTPSFMSLYFGEHGVYSLEFMKKLSKPGSYKKYFDDISSMIDSLSRIDYTIYNGLYVPHYQYSWNDGKLAELCESLLRSNYIHYANNLTYFKKMFTVVPSGKKTNCMPQQMFYVFIGITPTFYSLRMKALYEEECKTKGLRIVNQYDLRNGIYSKEELDLYVDFIDKENDYILGLPNSEDYYIISYGYEGSQNKTIYELEAKHMFL